MSEYMKRTVAAAQDASRANFSGAHWRPRLARVAVANLGMLQALGITSWDALSGALTPHVVIGMAITTIGASYTGGAPKRKGQS